MSFGDHLDELRSRLIKGLLAPVIFLIPALYFGKDILRWLIVPVNEALLEADLPGRLQALSPVEPFVMYFKVALLIAFIFGGPALIWQLWAFVAPGLYPRERRFAHLLVPLSALLTTIGVLFLIYIALPISLTMMIRFTKGIDWQAPRPPQSATVERPPDLALPTMPILDVDPPQPQAGEMWFNARLNQLRIVGSDNRVYSVDAQFGGLITQQFQLKTYINFVFVLGFAFAIAFQLPVVILLLGWVGIVDVAMLRRVRKYAMFTIVVIAAVLTPPDFISQIAMAAPLYLLYELSIIMLRIWPSAGRFAAAGAQRGRADDAGPGERRRQ